jgi:hypothetical protein
MSAGPPGASIIQNLAGVNRPNYNLLHTSWLAKRGCSAYTKGSSFAFDRSVVTLLQPDLVRGKYV